MDIYYAAPTCTGKWQISRVDCRSAPSWSRAPGHETAAKATTSS